MVWLERAKKTLRLGMVWVIVISYFTVSLLEKCFSVLFHMCKPLKQKNFVETKRNKILFHNFITILLRLKDKRLKPITYIAPQATNESCSGALRHRQSGRAAYRP